MNPGTIELAARELSSVLEPLADTLGAAHAADLFAHLGLRIPNSVLNQPLIAGPLSTAENAAGALAARRAALDSSLSGGDTLAVTQAGAALLQAITSLFNALDALGNAFAALPGASVPGIDAPTLADFAANLRQRLLANAVVSYMQPRVPTFSGVLALTGVLDNMPSPGDAANPAKPGHMQRDLHLERLPDLLTNPAGLLRALYGWGDPAFNTEALLRRIAAFLGSLGLVARVDSLGPGQFALQSLFASIVPDASVTPHGFIARLHNSLDDGTTRTFNLTPNWAVTVVAKGAFAAETELKIYPPAKLTLIPPAPGFNGSMTSTLALSGPPFVLFGITGGSRLEITTCSIGIGVAFSAQGPASEGQLRMDMKLDGKAIIDTSKGDSFLNFLTDGARGEASFSLSADWTPAAGLRFSGSSGLEIALPVHAGIGPAKLEGFYLRGGVDGGSISVEISAAIAAALGPLQASVDRIGILSLARFPKSGGNLGPLDLGFEFKPPKGAGLSLDVGIIKGGGFLSCDADKGEYVGAMELDFIGIISLKAIAIINTKMPDGSKGFSLLVIITADFPPIQLGFGFTLNAVGGLLGLNRTVNMDALREGVRTNAIKSVLFPQDVVANITRIVSDLKQIFPPLDERFIVGPMAELGWGTPSIITLELGILIEIPVPRIAILGVLAAFLPAEELALLRIQVNFLGVIDFENKYISFDASLFDSRLLIYTLTGDMAFRLSWGDNPMFVLSVGGFHPAYHDAPQDLQHMTRLGISLLGGDNPRISVMSYFAVTSNTVQFGARAELYAEAAGFNVYGFIGFDVLFQFDPFKFIASFEAGLALREGTDTIMGIHLAGQLSGVNPWNARGEASITILFLKVSVSFDETWGDSADKIDPPKEDIVARLTAEINDDRNWKAEIPDSNNLHVSIRKMELPPDQIVIHPMGVLTFSERLVPLAIEITKFGNKVPLDARRFDIEATDPGILTETVTEEFAPANFFDKNDSEKLSSPSFDRLTSGFKVTGASSLVMPTAVNKSVEYELTYLREKRTQLFRADDYRMANHVFKASTKASAATVSTLSYARNRISVNAPDAVAVAPPQYAVANVSDMRLAGPGLVAGSYTEAQQKYSALIARRPELKDQVQVLAHHELNHN
jgi:hypothetical protein